MAAARPTLWSRPVRHHIFPNFHLSCLFFSCESIARFTLPRRGRQRRRTPPPHGHAVEDAGIPRSCPLPPLSVRWAERPWAEAQARPARLLSPRACKGRKAVSGRWIPLGRPVSNKKNDFSFFFYYLKIERVWKMFDYSNLLQICSNKFF
jgi:hypothetical protein